MSRLHRLLNEQRALDGLSVTLGGLLVVNVYIAGWLS